ncbi:Response regulator receiver domain-containing protein [Catalinimonas alkaloidigena]|uniref:Response regulator receiver domain-containing protein n=1 Tax=Catalinimonas alkaloidigena TaxID=1075417 RepID=A0A1G9ATL8_9BACT|nr:response regulator [Catalinimonas alkaloidigena]SDK30597.1 Response regulator receiver domain-containing protein [Catalinimonas alkaloidigena]
METNPLVLLVDDNDTDNLINRRMLKLLAFTERTVIANSGRKGLAYLREHKDNPEQLPDLVFLDINMPEIDGFTFMENFSALAPQLKKKVVVMVLSSSDDPQDINRITANPHVAYFITKPLDPAKMSVVQEVFSYQKSQ